MEGVISQLNCDWYRLALGQIADTPCGHDEHGHRDNRKGARWHAGPH